MKNLQAEKLFFRRSEDFVLGPLSLHCGEGEILSLVGPNGGGKSTLLALLSGILKPLEGGVFFKDENLKKKEPREIARKIAYLPQKISPLYAYSAGEVVAMGLFCLGDGDPEKKQTAAAVLCAMEKTKTASFYGRSFLELSGGEQQRVLLSSLLVRSPEILLLDEPTSGLDPQHSVEFFKLIRKESASGLSAIVACHDLNLAASFSDRMVVMDHGKILAEDLPAKILGGKILEAFCGEGMKAWPHPDGRGGFVLLPEREGSRS